MARIYRISDSATWRDVGDEIVILETTSSTYYSLNGTGAELWHMMLDGTTEADLRQRLIAAHGLESEQAVADVQAFLEQCGELLIVEDAE